MFYFIEKFKNVLVHEVYNKKKIPGLSNVPNIREAQIRLFVNGMVDLVVDYYKGNISISLEDGKI